MKTYKSSEIFAPLPKTSSHLLTIGSFDGVHLGHRKILEKLLQKKQEIKNSTTILLTFDPHPRKLFKNNIKLITTLEEKLFLFEKIGLDVCIVEPFTQEYANYDPEEYVREVLIQRIRPDYVLVGYDHRFGKQRAGNFDLLQRLASVGNYEAEQVPPVEFEGIVISSSKIRKLISQGHIATSNRLLGYPFFVAGKVLEGKKLGRTLGYPTINLEIPEDKLLPSTGVYAGKVFLKNETRIAMINLGFAPTAGKNPLRLEAHILDFSGNLYGEKVRLEFHLKIREERKFASLQELQKQLEKDKEFVREYFHRGGLFISE